MAYIAYNTASAQVLGTGDTVDEARTRGGRLGICSDYLIVLDAGDDADHIASGMQSHRLIDNLKSRCSVAWRGADAIGFNA